MDHGSNSKWSLQALQTAAHIYSWGEADLWEPCIVGSVSGRRPAGSRHQMLMVLLAVPGTAWCDSIDGAVILEK